MNSIITIGREFNVVSVINLASLIGWGVDAATRSIIKYGKKGYQIELKKNNKTSLSENPTKIEINTKEKNVTVYVIEK